MSQASLLAALTEISDDVGSHIDELRDIARRAIREHAEGAGSEPESAAQVNCPTCGHRLREGGYCSYCDANKAQATRLSKLFGAAARVCALHDHELGEPSRAEAIEILREVVNSMSPLRAESAQWQAVGWVHPKDFRDFMEGETSQIELYNCRDSVDFKGVTSVALYTAPPSAPEPVAVLPVWWGEFLINVCELPDRTSPDDDPEALIVSIVELESCAMRAIEGGLND